MGSARLAMLYHSGNNTDPNWGTREQFHSFLARNPLLVGGADLEVFVKGGTPDRLRRSLKAIATFSPKEEAASRRLLGRGVPRLCASPKSCVKNLRSVMKQLKDFQKRVGLCTALTQST